MTALDEFLSDIFHSCALRAYAEVAAETRTNRPSSKTVRERAYKYYEDFKREQFALQEQPS